MNSNPANDHADLGRLQQGDELALNRLIARWERPLFAFAWRYLQNTEDARDLVAEAFVRLHQQRARLRSETNLPAWLFTTLQNLCHNHHRWCRRHPTVALDESGGPEATAGESPSPFAASAPAPDAALVHGEALAALAAAVERLPHELKVTLLLHHYQSLSYREIGEITGCAPRGVETRLYRARQQLRQDLAMLLNESVGS